MSIFPNFLLKKIYCKGSLRETAEGIVFDLKNLLAPGIITGINFVKINDSIYHSSAIKLITAGAAIIAEHITPENPVLFKINQEGTCILEGARGLQEGLNKIMVDLISRDLGAVQVTLTDSV